MLCHFAFGFPRAAARSVGASGRRRRKFPLSAAAFALACLAALPARGESLTFEQVLARAAAVDASLRIARLELERARLETDRVESQLGWVASGDAGVERAVNIFGSPVDRVDANANFERRLSSGSSLGVGVGTAREDAETAFLPFLPNPSDTVRADATYRVPLRQGAGGVAYQQGLEAAAAGIEAAQADYYAARSDLAQQVADLFYAAAFTYERLRNAQEAVERAERLKRFVERNVRLGVSEEKDRLQAEAQVRARLAEQRALRAQWENQRIALNRLMERAWDSEWAPLIRARSAKLADLAALEAQALAASPELERERARLRAAEAAIARTRDAVRDRVDLVFSVGNRRQSGDLPGGGELSRSEPVAGVRLEYRAALDDRGATAELGQAYLQRDVARERLDTTETSLRYTVARLAAEADALAAALAQARAREQAERRKLDEATQRHRTGRANTAELIQFENDFEAAALAVEQQAIELARRLKELERVTGAVWRGIEPVPAAPQTKP